MCFQLSTNHGKSVSDKLIQLSNKPDIKVSALRKRAEESKLNQLSLILPFARGLLCHVPLLDQIKLTIHCPQLTRQ